jgi:hypothetical protein
VSSERRTDTRSSSRRIVDCRHHCVNPLRRQVRPERFRVTDSSGTSLLGRTGLPSGAEAVWRPPAGEGSGCRTTPVSG